MPQQHKHRGHEPEINQASKSQYPMVLLIHSIYTNKTQPSREEIELPTRGWREVSDRERKDVDGVQRTDEGFFRDLLPRMMTVTIIVQLNILRREASFVAQQVKPQPETAVSHISMPL